MENALAAGARMSAADAGAACASTAMEGAPETDARNPTEAPSEGLTLPAFARTPAAGTSLAAQADAASKRGSAHAESRIARAPAPGRPALAQCHVPLRRNGAIRISG